MFKRLWGPAIPFNDKAKIQASQIVRRIKGVVTGLR